jgi:hypothetical protein
MFLRCFSENFEKKLEEMRISDLRFFKVKNGVFLGEFSDPEF